MSTKIKSLITSALLITLLFNVGLFAEGSPYWINCYGDACLLNGEPLPVGAVIDAYTKDDGVHCGQQVVTEAGKYKFMPVYLDDPYSPEIEGADLEDTIVLVINGITSTVELGPDIAVWENNGDIFHVNLSATQTAGVEVINPPGQYAVPSQNLIFTFTVRNTGSGIDLYDLNSYSEHGWTTEILSVNPTPNIDPDATVDVEVRLQVPGEIFASMVDSIFLEITSKMDNTVSVLGKSTVAVEYLDAEDDNSSVLPDNFELYQNYPNPFNPETVIEYSLERSGNVRLEVFNILGQSARILVDEFQDAGDYKVVWNTLSGSTSYPSGVYFYRLTVDANTLTRKMVLMK